MLFKEELREAIVQGRKTQTRRPPTPKSGFKGVCFVGEAWVGDRWQHGTYHAEEFIGQCRNIEEVYIDNRLKFKVGKDYAVQYGYGLPACVWQPHTQQIIPYETYCNKPTLGVPLRIRITKLRFEDVRNISHEDALAEGFTNRLEFWRVWTSFYDKKAFNALQVFIEDTDSRDYLLQMCHDRHYQAVAINFEVVK